MKLHLKLVIMSVVAVCLSSASLVKVSAYTFNQDRVIDNAIFDDTKTMSAVQIDTFLNGFPASCISPNSGFRSIDPTGYNPTSGYQYGGYVTAGQVIYDSGQAYGLNPQVLLTTLQKEQSLVIGGASYCNDGDQHKYAAAVGYGCPDSVTRYSYDNLNLYQRNGVTVSSTGTTCVNSASKAGFSQQVIRAAWLLKFGEQRSQGNVGWAVIKGAWNNSDDPQTCYGGPMTQGTFARCPSGGSAYYDGYVTIDSTAVHMNNGATAALYWYTPHFNGNRSFFSLFTGWFGSTILANLPGCDEATNTVRACIWGTSSTTNSDQFLTSSIGVRDDLYVNQGYQYAGKAFFGNVVSLPGNLPVYRASKSGGGSFITVDKNEYNSLVAAGYSGDGIDFYADPFWSNSGYPVYRLYSPTSHQHYWTTDQQQRQSLLQSGYSDEGIAFTSISSIRQEVAPPQGNLLVYRFYIAQTYSHLWTTDLNERDNMIKAGYAYEGVAWNSFASTSRTPVYRLYAASIQQHLYTTDLSEKNNLVASGGWVYEGISQYVSAAVNSQPVYRLYAPTLGVHLMTVDANERGQLLSSGRWNNEGVAWYQP